MTNQRGEMRVMMIHKGDPGDRAWQSQKRIRFRKEVSPPVLPWIWSLKTSATSVPVVDQLKSELAISGGCDGELLDVPPYEPRYDCADGSIGGPLLSHMGIADRFRGSIRSYGCSSCQHRNITSCFNWRIGGDLLSFPTFTRHVIDV